ncbi:MAG: Dehydrogenase [Gallionellaceae bacterium]|nr:MAG: Dehydrogenase [Gallionellaceae bacterium]
MVGVIGQCAQHGGVAILCRHHGIERGAAVFLVNELVHQQVAALRPFDVVKSVAALLPGFHVGAVFIPEILRQRQHTAIQQVGVFQHLVVEIVLRGQPERARLDAHVDVFADQDHRALRLLLLQEQHHAEDGVVGLAVLQRGRQLVGDKLGLQEQPPGGGMAALCLQRDALADIVRGFTDDRIEKAAGLAGVARDFRHALLAVIQVAGGGVAVLPGDMALLKGFGRTATLHGHGRPP